MIGKLWGSHGGIQVRKVGPGHFMARFDKVAFRYGVLLGDPRRFDNAIMAAAR